MEPNSDATGAPSDLIHHGPRLSSAGARGVRSAYRHSSPVARVTFYQKGLLRRRRLEPGLGAGGLGGRHVAGNVARASSCAGIHLYRLLRPAVDVGQGGRGVGA